MTQCVAFHSYKGGTGKTTIASNLAAMLTSKGRSVALLDLDVYAPSLQAYFEKTPIKWLNDVLTEDVGARDMMVDMTKVVEGLVPDPKKVGKLWIGFSNPQKEEVYKLEGGSKQSPAKILLLRRFIQLREELVSDFGCDYIIIDTSPGIRYWSINSLAIADTLLLTLKFGDLDIDGTRSMANDIYGAFEKFGAKSYLLLNRVAGYCVPNTLILPQSTTRSEGAVSLPQFNENEIATALSKDVSMDIISAIPCYCDIQFTRKEFLTVLRYPNHPFAKQLDALTESTLFKT